MDSSHHLYLQWKFKLLAGKFTWGNKAKHCWKKSTNFWKQKFVDNANLKQTFMPIIWIFTEGEGDEIESRLSSKIFLTLISWINVISEIRMLFQKWFHTIVLCGKKGEPLSKIAPHFQRIKKPDRKNWFSWPTGFFTRKCIFQKCCFCIGRQTRGHNGGGEGV